MSHALRGEWDKDPSFGLPSPVFPPTLLVNHTTSMGTTSSSSNTSGSGGDDEAGSLLMMQQQQQQQQQQHAPLPQFPPTFLPHMSNAQHSSDPAPTRQTSHASDTAVSLQPDVSHGQFYHHEREAEGLPSNDHMQLMHDCSLPPANLFDTAGE